MFDFVELIAVNKNDLVFRKINKKRLVIIYISAIYVSVKTRSKRKIAVLTEGQSRSKKVKIKC